MQRRKEDGCRGQPRRERQRQLARRSFERICKRTGMTPAQVKRGLLEIAGVNRIRKTWCSYVLMHNELTPNGLTAGLEAVARELAADDAVGTGVGGSGGSARKGVLA